MPPVPGSIDVVAIGNRGSKVHLGAVDVAASVQIVVAHPLQQILEVTFIWLKDAVQNSAVVEQIGKSSHMHRVEQVDFQEKPVSNIVTVKRYPFDKGDVSNIDRFPVVRIPAICCSECVIDGRSKAQDI